jgi:hypothetical protein
MNEEFKRKWVEALRSGKYAQGTGRLRDGDSFCCLGVLCDLSDSSKWDGFRTYDGATALPPFRLARDVGIPGGECIVTECRDRRGESVTLAELNDHGFSYAQIADVIEHFL